MIIILSVILNFIIYVECNNFCSINSFLRTTGDSGYNNRFLSTFPSCFNKEWLIQQTNITEQERLMGQLRYTIVNNVINNLPSLISKFKSNSNQINREINIYNIQSNSISIVNLESEYNGKLTISNLMIVVNELKPQFDKLYFQLDNSISVKIDEYDCLTMFYPKSFIIGF
jgi:hypothetical protein